MQHNIIKTSILVVTRSTLWNKVPYVKEITANWFAKVIKKHVYRCLLLQDFVCCQHLGSCLFFLWFEKNKTIILLIALGYRLFWCTYYLMSNSRFFFIITQYLIPIHLSLTVIYFAINNIRISAPLKSHTTSTMSTAAAKPQNDENRI